MRENRILKIGLSLLIALCFLLPTGAVMAAEPRLVDPNGEGYADERPDIEFNHKEVLDADIAVAGRIDEANNPVILQNPETSIGAFIFENPAGEQILVLSGDTIPVADFYKPVVNLVNPGPEDDVVEPEMELYKWDPENCDILFEESFEDNAHNYMWWKQIDGDASDIGTYYDGWAWSDARACDGDHSFKNTMYDEYKNMQDDYLVMKQCVDISEYSQVTVYFDIFVAGEYDSWYVDTWGDEVYTPLDYLEAGIIDDDIMYFFDNGDGQSFLTVDGYWMPGNYFFFDTSLPLFDIDTPAGEPKDYTDKAMKIDECPGWWRVWMDIPTEILTTPECFGIWFGFHSDKERVYEGAYVDNIVIEGCTPDGQKIYQGHSQDWLTIPEGTTQFEFPLVWDDVEPGIYKAIVKVKNDEGGYDQIKEIVFEIGNDVDCAITDMYVEDDFTMEVIPDGGIMTYTADAHIPFTYHNGGNVPLEDVAVHAAAYKLEEEELFFDDFEGMSNWVYFYEECPLTAITAPEWAGNGAWSGSKALYLGDPDIMSVVPGCNYIGYSQSYFDMEGVEEAWLDFYFMGALPAGAVVRVCVLGYRYIVGIGGVLESFPGVMQSGGMCELDWIGPMQPMCNYERIDWMSLWDIMVANGYMYDDNGHMTYDTGIGLWLDTTGCNDFYPSNCVDPYKPWSGIFFDDIKISAKRVGEKVWEDAMIIPGPCDPSETCSDQFTWEDVPYSDYIICVDAFCEDDSNSQNNEICSSIIVLEDLEKMSKVDFVDYTDVDCPDWCISNVVGAGDHYALATNCDTHLIPDAIGMGIGPQIDGDDCAPSLIDISHLSICGPPPTLFYDFETGPMGWTVVDGDGAEPNWEYGSVVTPAGDAGGATGSWFYIDDDGAGSGAGDSFDNWLISPAHDLTGYGSLELDFDGDFEDFAGYGELTVYANDGVTDYVVGVYSSDVDPDGFNNVPAIDISVIAGSSAGVIKFHYDDDDYWGWGAHIDNVEILPAKGGNKATVFTSGFEGTPFDIDFASNTGWLNSLYGYANSGVQWAYSWTQGDTLTTPAIPLQCDSELRFWYAVESSFHPMDLEVYCNGNLVFSDYGYDSTTYAEAVIDLSAYDETSVVIEFVGLTSDFYGQMLDDVTVTTEDCVVIDCDEIPYEFEWQSSLYEDYAEVQFVVAGLAGVGVEEWSVYGYDSYGDGWDAYYDYVPDCFVDVYIGTEKVVDAFTVDYMSNEVFFNVSEGDQVRAVYYSEYPPEVMDYETEHYWELRGPVDVLYASDMPPARESVGPFGGGNCEGCPDEVCPNLDWQVVETFEGFAEGVAAGDIAPYLPEGATAFTWAFIYNGVGGAPGIGFHLHDFAIDWGTGYYEDFEDGNKVSEAFGITWTDFCYAPGTGIWATEVDPHTYTIDQPAGGDNAIIWCTEIEDAYEAYFTGYWSYSIAGGSLLSLELSADGGNTWFTIALIGDDEDDDLSSGHEMIPCTTFDLTPWAGSEVCFRTRLQGQGTVTITDFTIAGKQDRMPPTVSISLSGNNIGGNMYAGPVTVTINAEDDMGMGEIHYVLDGTESVVSGDTASFTVSGDGSHNVEAWGVDATGNEGAHVSTSFTIDASPPTVAITAPEPGLYLFGNKLLSMSKPFIIGAFTIEATADDAQGVYVVQFMLNGEVIGEDTEAPYDTYCAVKNMGGATLKAVAIDGVGNTAEDTLDVTYYKFL